jgi:hypothetical protein
MTGRSQTLPGWSKDDRKQNTLEPLGKGPTGTSRTLRKQLFENLENSTLGDSRNSDNIT